MKKLTLALTIGDPAGIGPELILKLLSNREICALANLIVIGSKSALRAHAARVSHSVPAAMLVDGSYSTPELTLEDLPLEGEVFRFGEATAECGRASYQYLERAMDLVKEQKVDAIVTGPIHKESWRAGGVPHIGHTEALAEYLNCHAETVFVVERLRIFFLSRHVSLKKAIELISVERVLTAFRNARESLRWFGLTNPRIAVAGLNPHAGNGGLFGDEEERFLTPAALAARAEGIDAYGPLSSDSAFYQCAKGEYDGVISLYHDQGHIAAKMKSFHGTVAVTTGLPVIRTSVDHGTAFDIAGKDRGDPGSLISAVKLAVELAMGRQKILGKQRC